VSSAFEKELTRLTGETNFAAALVKIEGWARSHKALSADAPAPGAGDLDPSVAREMLDDVAQVLGSEPDHDSIQEALDALFALVTGTGASGDPSAPSPPLSAQQLSTCRAMGCDPKDFAAAKRALNRPLQRRR